MTRALALLFVLCLPGLLFPAGNPAVGKWDLTATDANGHDSKWMLTITEADGRLSGEISNSEATLKLEKVSLKDKTLTFVVVMNEQPYGAETTVNGDSMEGKYSGPDASGTLKATRRP